MHSIDIPNSCGDCSVRLSSSVHSNQLGSRNAPETSSAGSKNQNSLSKKRARHSLNVLGSFSKEISALIRSHSSSRQQPSHTDDSEMYGCGAEMDADHDRPSRKSKSENRFYKFITRSLTRSRSRSRSRNGHAPPLDPNEPMPELPGRHERTNDSQYMSSKPASRIQSRPISSTTTATNTTITPGTPRPKRRPPSSLPLSESPKLVDSQPSQPSTPRPSTREKLHNLFGLPLASPKKSSFDSSQQDSRQPSSDVALPLDVLDNDITPKPLKPYPPKFHSRPQSPSPIIQASPPVRNPSGSSTNTSSTSASSRLHKLFSGQKAAPSLRTDEVSGPLRRPSPSHRRNNSANSRRSPNMLSSDRPPSRTNVTGTIGPPSPPNLNIPSTSARSQVPDSALTTSLKEHALASSQRKDSVEKGKDRDASGVNGLIRGSTTHGPRHSHRSTKHGSFDFERPGWSAGGVIQRTGSGGTTDTGTSGTTGTFGRGSLLGGIRESSMGPGLAGVGTLQREVSVKRGKEREEMMQRAREEERKQRKATQQGGEKETPTRTGREKGKGSSLDKHRSLQPPSRVRSPDESNDRTVTPTAEKSSSLGRKRGGLLRGGSSGGKPQIASLGLSHGAFSFERPVPSPTWSTASVSNGHDGSFPVSWAEKGRVERDKERGKANEVTERERERRKERERENISQNSSRRDRAPVPVPAPNLGHRSGLKGRSLDLGLELAWAPMGVREDALLTSSSFFARSLSGSSSLAGRSAKSAGNSGSTNGGHGTIEEEPDRSGVGREVAEVFKSALDAAGYAAFKKYVHQFDAHDIPFDGPAGIVARVEKLLTVAPDLSEDGKRRLLDDFVRIILQNA